MSGLLLPALVTAAALSTAVRVLQRLPQSTDMVQSRQLVKMERTRLEPVQPQGQFTPAAWSVPRGQLPRGVPPLSRAQERQAAAPVFAETRDTPF